MGSHPVNLTLRFVLELIAFASLAWWGWTLADGPARIVVAVAFALLAMLTWGLFNVPDDPSRSGRAPVVVPGPVRLLIEFLVFGAGAWALAQVTRPAIAFTFVGLLVGHYAISYDRIRWLWSR